MKVFGPGGSLQKGFILTGSVVVALLLGVSLGVFLNYAAGVDHPIASKPIKVEYCFLFSHEDLFRGQPVETDAHYMLAIEGAGIGKEDCPENDAQFFGPPEDDPITREWEREIHRQPSPVEFDISFVGIVPSYPRYRHWYADAKDLWRGGHHVAFIRIQRLTHFQRTR